LWHTRRLAGAPIAARAICDVVADGRAEEVSGDDFDALPVHLGEQHLSSRIDETDVRKLDPDRDSRLCLSGAPPRTPELPDPFVYDTTPNISGTLGPLTNLVAPATIFPLGAARLLGGGDDSFAKDTRGSLLLVGDTCDLDTDCCVTVELEIFYGCSELYCLPERPGIAGPVSLWIRRDCFDSNEDEDAACNTTLVGSVLTQP